MKAIIVFQKLYPISMCSHLDLQRIFGRAFSRAGLPVEYSKGFNPHPELSFAQPLSLGFEGASEILEVAVHEALPEQEFVQRLNAVLPEGLRATQCVFVEGGPKAASLVSMADYEIVAEALDGQALTEACRGFMEQTSVTVIKPPKNKEVDIRPLVFDMRSEGNVIFARLACALNPKLLISALGCDIVSVKRTALLGKDGVALVVGLSV